MSENEEQPARRRGRPPGSRLTAEHRARIRAGGAASAARRSAAYAARRRERSERELPAYLRTTDPVGRVAADLARIVAAMYEKTRDRRQPGVMLRTLRACASRPDLAYFDDALRRALDTSLVRLAPDGKRYLPAERENEA